MNVVPFAPSILATFWADVVNYPLAIVGTILFVVALHKLANHFRCYGLPRNLLFGAVTGALALALAQSYALWGGTFGLRSLVLGELVAGFEVAVVLTLVRRLVFSQQPPRPPREAVPVEDSVRGADE